MVTVTPYRERPPLDLAAICASEAAPAYCTREQIAARVAACRACSDSIGGSATCAACDLRCAHAEAQPGAQLLAVTASTCPRNLWPSVSA